MHGILTFIKRLTGLCLQSLHHRFVTWTKPDTTSLLLLTLIDQACSKSDLVAENVLLRRQGKQPARTSTDRMVLVLLARIVRSWKQALISVQEDDAPTRAASGLQILVEGQVEGSFSQAKHIPRDRGLDPGDGQGQPTVGS